MLYKDIIDNLISNIRTDIIDLSVGREIPSPPTQVSSEFLTNKEQGDWAEQTLLHAINNNAQEYIVVHYGKSDDIVAGQDGFKEFYEKYQKELDTIGKRPDLLLFRKSDFPYSTSDISSWSLEEQDKIVSKAICGIEVRSSAFLIEKYELFMANKIKNCTDVVMALKKDILDNFGELLKEKNETLYNTIRMIDRDNLETISFRCISYRSSEALFNMSEKIKLLKEQLTEIAKRKYLSITPKIEDLKVVYNWVKKYNVPHYYVQVFFDKAYGISFQKILELLANPDEENKAYFIEGDVKNQNKQTIKISANKEKNILERIDLPKHYSEMRELYRGRLLYYVKFEKSIAVLNIDEFEELFGICLR